VRSNAPLLRNRLLGWLLIPLLIVLTADGTLGYWAASRFSERVYDKSLVDIARELSLQLKVSGPRPRVVVDLPQEARRILLTDPTDRLYFGVTAAEGSLVAGRTFPQVAVGAGGEDTPTRLYDAHIDGSPVRVVRLIVAPELVPRSIGAVIYVAETKKKRNLLVGEVFLSELVPQVLLILISVLVVQMGVHRGLAPLTRVQTVVSSRSPADLTPIPISEIPGELRPLLQSINDLLERLGAALSAQSRFIDDAAHQLKSPLAALEAQIELALREGDAARMHDAMSRAMPAVERVARTVSQLLSLARNEPYAASSVTLVPVDLRAIAFQAAASWVPAALKKNIDLGFEGTQAPLPVLGDRGRLCELLDNLLENALQYSPEGGRVTLGVSALPAPSFAVTDEAPRISDDEKKRIFERFYRPLGNIGEGSGLGLAIVQNIAQIHGARVAVHPSRDGGGNTFEVTFPPISRSD
jgi:two-component system sensor histidine kinase TctE